MTISPKTTKTCIEDGIDLVGAQDTEKIVQEMHAQLMGYFAAMNARSHVVYAPPSNGSQVPTFAVLPLPSHVFVAARIFLKS